MRTQRKKHSRLWVYLLYLGLVTSLILSVTLARYASSAAGQGTAAVAAWAGGGESLTSEPIQMVLNDLLPGGRDELKFQVVNFTGDTVSEVALDYEIEVKTEGNLPLTFSLAARKETGADPASITVPDGEILTGSGSREESLQGGYFPLTAGKQAHTYTLTVTWPATENSADYAKEVDLVTIIVTARQRLAGGGTAPGT